MRRLGSDRPVGAAERGRGRGSLFLVRERLEGAAATTITNHKQNPGRPRVFRPLRPKTVGSGGRWNGMFQARSRSALILGREGLPRIKSTLMAGQPSCIKIKEYLILIELESKLSLDIHNIALLFYR